MQQTQPLIFQVFAGDTIEYQGVEGLGIIYTPRLDKPSIIPFKSQSLEPNHPSVWVSFEQFAHRRLRPSLLLFAPVLT
jgi:hypothetical protein